MNIKEISTSRLREYENNPRNNDLAVEKVKYSIERFGFLFPVVVDMNYVIVCGHTRVRACRELGIQSVPCIIADELSEEQINLFRLIDNKTSEYSDWDFEKLKSELSTVDLTLDKNQLLLEHFELTAEVFDIEPEQAEIRVPTFNFMGVNDDKPINKKTSVSTIHSDGSANEDAIGNCSNDSAEEDYKAPQEFDTENSSEEENGYSNNNESLPDITDEDFVEAESSAETETVTKVKTSKPLRPLYQFRFGDVAFFISKIELDKLNEKYAVYLDSEKSLSMSFVDFLLERRDKID